MSGLSEARPTGQRWAPTCVIALVCWMLAASPPMAATRAEAGFAGTIKDSVGQVLDGVEILIVRRSSSVGASVGAAAAAVAPIANVSSDSWGRFAIPDLTPGLYSIAALKKGYRTYIGNVDTRIERVIDVVLVPMPAQSNLAPGTVPQDEAWRLRLPRRTVFRDTEDGVAAVEPEDGVTAAALEVPIQMRVDQLFAVGAPFPSQSGEPVKLQGNETRVRLAAPLGQRGSLRLDGRRESLGSALESVDGAKASSESAGISVDFAYDTSPDSRFALKAFYGERDLDWDVTAASPLGSRRQSWGYESEWQKQLGDRSSVRVALDFNDDLVRLSSPEFFGEIGIPASDSARSRRTVVAGGVFESLAGDRHQVEVGFTARLFDSPGSFLALENRKDDRAALDAPAMGGLNGGSGGFDLAVSAQDSWAMTGPFTLLYGVDYRRAMTDRATVVVAPSMGGAWAIDRVALRFMLSYHAVAQQEQARATSKHDALGSPLLAGARGRVGGDWPLSAREVGYEAEVELPLTGTLRFKGASSFVPIQFEGIGAPLHAADAANARNSASYLADGAAAVGETSLSLVQDLGDARTWVEISRGQAQGMLAMGSDQHAELPTLALGELIYDNGSWGLQLIPSGTDLRVHYKRVVESQTGDHDAGPIAERETVELRLIQNLMRFEGLGNWRLLMAVRMAMQGNEDDRRLAEATDPAVLRAFNEGVSAGLSVTF